MYEPSLRQLPGHVEHVEPPLLPPAAARARVLRDLVDVEALAQETPLVVVLDDLQWADELTLACMSLLVGALARTRSLLFGTYRKEETTETLRALMASETVTLVALGRLTGRPVEFIVSEMLALPAPPDGFVDFLAAQSRATLSSFANTLCAAVGAGVLFRRTSLGQWRLADSDAGRVAYQTLGLPTTLLALVTGRIDQLSPLARALLDAAAIMGRRISMPPSSLRLSTCPSRCGWTPFANCSHDGYSTRLTVASFASRTTSCARSPTPWPPPHAAQRFTREPPPRSKPVGFRKATSPSWRTTMSLAASTIGRSNISARLESMR